MTHNNDKINQLLDKLDILLKRQEDFSKEINILQIEILKLKTTENKLSSKMTEVKVDERIDTKEFELKKETNSINNHPNTRQALHENQKKSITPIKITPIGKSDLEKFIGENLINKIGIAITVIGVAIGAKYSIENDLISPLTRIILGYLFGLTLFGVGIKLKSKYENYSAVLVSGAMAIMYFITYSAYNFYNLIPQIFAFSLMLIFTVFTVVAAINYNRQIIAHIGLVGAYAVPFLLSEGSGKIAILFTYMAIINIGILVIAFKKYWKLLYYASFVLTWLIFFSWYINKYESNDFFELAVVFNSLYFVIFYLTFLAYKLLQKEKFQFDDVLLLIINSFVFYGIGYSILNSHKTGHQLLGVFTLINAIVHFVVSIIIYRQKLLDKNIQYLISGLVLVYITLAVPVQLDGNWVTLMWAGESTLLFWIGRTKGVHFYEKLSYPIIILAFCSIIQDWGYVYDVYNPEIPTSRIVSIFNVNFLSSILFIIAFIFINFLNQNKKYPSYLENKKGIYKVIQYAIPAILIYSIYYTFRIEIATYWNQLYTDSEIKVNVEKELFPDYFWNKDLLWFKSIWILNYSLLFVSILAFFNLKKIKNKQFRIINLVLIIIVLILFLTRGLYNLSELRDNLLEQNLSQFYKRGTMNLWIRYISFPFVALALYTLYKIIKEEFTQNKFKLAFEFILHTTILWILSSELINWMDIFKSEQSYKLGLSILWGIYSLFLISYGIWKKNKPLRVGAISLFGLTLIKLFFYDISHLNTISKTIVFVSLGILLLIISFLYNKYRHSISDDEANK